MDIPDNDTRKVPYCVYCGDETNLTRSRALDDGTVYPGAQMICADAAACAATMVVVVGAHA